jgi:nucleoside-diphosphate-sugar epimerase
VVLSLAGLVDPGASAAALHEANVARPARLAAAAAAEDVRRFVHLSSMSVFGKFSDSPLTPNSPLRPENDYGHSRAEGESRLLEVCERTGLSLTIVRSPMVYGEAGGGFHALLKLVRSGLPLPLGLASAPRSFCSLANLASALVTAASRSDQSGILMPADPSDLSASEMCAMIGDALGRRPRLAPVPPAAMKILLSFGGQEDRYRSMFEPMQIDRAHWDDWGWVPTQTAAAGIAEAVHAGSDPDVR